MSSAPLSEQQAISSVAAEYESRGYSVTVEPKAKDLPAFFAGYEPDLIATNATESVVVEVRTGRQGAVADKLSKLASEIAILPGWRLEVIAVPSDFNGGAPLAGSLLSIEEILTLQAQARQLSSGGSSLGAFFLYWSIVEAILRRLAITNQLPLDRLPTARLLGELASQGIISRHNNESARSLLEVRNRLSHGYAALPGEVHVERLETLVDDLLTELQAPQR